MRCTFQLRAAVRFVASSSKKQGRHAAEESAVEPRKPEVAAADDRGGTEQQSAAAPSARAARERLNCTTMDAQLETARALPRVAETSSITWKRPSQFLPPIVEPTHAQSAPSVPMLAAPEPKTPAKKGAMAACAATPASKKGAATGPEPVKKPPPKHAHVFFSNPHDPDHRVAATQAATPVAQAAGAGHASAGYAAAPSHPSHPHTNTAATLTVAAHPPSSAQHLVTTNQQHHHLHHQEHHRIPRDFRRLWSADELEEIAKWRLEEARIECEKEQRERVYMGFEDAIAYIVNEHPRNFAQEEDVDAEDLADDGEDEENSGEGSSSDAISNDSSPWGILPPARVEITPNAISKPEFPHGDIVHGGMASLFRIVEQLFDIWSSHEAALSSSSPSPSSATEQLPPAFLWRAIYPQDANGIPLYNPGGKYSVKLFVFGKWRRVDVDDKLPVDDEGNITYLTSSMKSEIWPALLTKALLKVMHWLGDGSNGSDNVDNDTVKQTEGGKYDGGAIRMANTVISALTGWKISRWQPDCQEIAGRESTLQQLLEYIPSTNTPDESSDANADTGELFEGDGENSAQQPASPTKPPTEMKPRAIICCGSARGNHVLHPGEAALVTDIIGDKENTMVKFTSLKGPSSVPEEMLAVDKLEFLLIHPPFKNRDLHLQHWTVTKNDTATVGGGGTGDDPSHALLWTRFPNPTTHFVIVKSTRLSEEQAAGDSTSSEEERADPTELRHHHYHTQLVEVVFTLTRIPPVDPLASTTDTRLRSSREIAKHLPELDPHGSLILIEERVQSNQSSLSKKSQAPVVITLNTLASTRVLLPSLLGGDSGDRVFRVYPQPSLCYGYALQIESNERVGFQEPSTYWRNVCDVQVVNSDGVYPVLLPNSWNILFKHNVELTAPPAITTVTVADDSAVENQQHVELYVDLHLSDAMLGQYVHIAIVDDTTSEVTKLSSLCSNVSLPVSYVAHSQQYAFTIIVDCALQDFYVPEGKWHLTLGSNWLFKGSSSHAMKLTAFEGRYEANKPLLCFRDVLTAPKKSIWTSFELELLTEDNGAGGNSEGEDLSSSLAVKLEVVDSISEQLLSECVAMKSVRLLQLPRRSGGDEPDDGGGYIIQGTIDRLQCVIPAELCSLRPFRNRAGSDNTRQQEIKENNEDSAGGETDEAGAADIQTSFPSALPRNSIKWRLNCWSAEDVKLDVDRMKESKFEAIRASWAETAKDRNLVTNGAVSRLLFLGKMDAAEVKMKQDGVSDEQAKRLRARFEWLEAASAKMSDGVYLEQRVRGSGGSEGNQLLKMEERMKTVADFQEEDRLLQEEIIAAQSQLAQKREDRLAAREQRAQEVKELVQSIREQRSVALKKRLKLWQQRDAILLM